MVTRKIVDEHPGNIQRLWAALDDNHFEVEVGAMKMRIARDDIGEVVGRAADSPVKAARARGISVFHNPGKCPRIAIGAPEY